MTGSKWHASLGEMLAAVPRGKGKAPVAVTLEHGTLLAELYAPRGADRQPAHDRDEIYIVVKGSGWFVNAGERRPFAAGDFIFVEAGREHRFEDFTDDFAAWVIFFGPPLQEAAA